MSFWDLMEGILKKPFIDLEYAKEIGGVRYPLNDDEFDNFQANTGGQWR